jgi:hypothetical protein
VGGESFDKGRAIRDEDVLHVVLPQHRAIAAAHRGKKAVKVLENYEPQKIWREGWNGFRRNPTNVGARLSSALPKRPKRKC